MSKHRFKITPFANTSGSKAYRVSGTLDGKTIRKNFKTRPEAVAYRQQLEIEHLNGESEGQTVWTTLTHDQNRDAIAATGLLKNSKSTKSLTFDLRRQIFPRTLQRSRRDHDRRGSHRCLYRGPHEGL